MFSPVATVYRAIPVVNAYLYTITPATAQRSAYPKFAPRERKIRRPTQPAEDMPRISPGPRNGTRSATAALTRERYSAAMVLRPPFTTISRGDAVIGAGQGDCFCPARSTMDHAPPRRAAVPGLPLPRGARRAARGLARSVRIRRAAARGDARRIY